MYTRYNSLQWHSRGWMEGTYLCTVNKTSILAIMDSGMFLKVIWNRMSLSDIMNMWYMYFMVVE